MPWSRITEKVIVGEQIKDDKRTLKLIKHIATAKTDEELEILKSIAKEEGLKLSKGGQLSFNLGQDPFNSLFTLGFYNHGAEVIFGSIFNSFGICNRVAHLFAEAFDRCPHYSSGLKEKYCLTIRCKKLWDQATHWIRSTDF
ncbi:MAG: hypothetical protein M1483_04400 [Actinobacteria bacterium]|nr:hypothetical protein [Actinomycetota bacterium]MCL6104853.1 hypothetical protein [Actinomycetota bacterium]